MEKYREIIENLQPHRSKKQFYWFLILGIGYITLSIINYLNRGEYIWNDAFFLFAGLSFILGALFQKRRAEKYFIELNNTGINAKVALFASVNLKWNEIEEISLKPISIIFELKSDTKKELSLGYLSYSSVIEMKSKLKEFADEKGIICH